MHLVSWVHCTVTKNKLLKIKRKKLQGGKRKRGEKKKRPVWKYKKCNGQTWLQQKHLSAGCIRIAYDCILICNCYHFNLYMNCLYFFLLRTTVCLFVTLFAGLRSRLKEAPVLKHKTLKRLLLQDLEVDVAASLHPQLHSNYLQ